MSMNEGDDREIGSPDGSEADAGSPARPDLDPNPVRLPIEDSIDLHSFQPNEVASVIEEYLREARQAGFEEIRIIHGRGIGVQREIVRAVLARTPFVASFKDAPSGSGGWGATVASLLTERKRSV